MIEDIKYKLNLNNSEIFILWSLAIPILFFGFYPEPLINTIEVSINNLIGKSGITLALVERNHNGLVQDTHHNPMNAGFPNGSIKG